MLSSSGVLHPGQLVAFLLVATRFGALLMMSPPIGGGAVPGIVRLAIVVALSACFSGFAAVPAEGWQLSAVVPALAVEAALGATIAKPSANSPETCCRIGPNAVSTGHAAPGG